MKTNCSYAEYVTYNSALKFDYLFFDTPCICNHPGHTEFCSVNSLVTANRTSTDDINSFSADNFANETHCQAKSLHGYESDNDFGIKSKYYLEILN
jgi:hypothetical protein